MMFKGTKVRDEIRRDRGKRNIGMNLSSLLSSQTLPQETNNKRLSSRRYLPESNTQTPITPRP